MNTSLLETVKKLLSNTKETPSSRTETPFTGLGKGTGGVVPSTDGDKEKSKKGGFFSSLFDLKNLTFITSITGSIGTILKLLGRFGLPAALLGIISLLKDPRMLDFSKKLDEFSSKFAGFWDNTLEPIVTKVWDLFKDGIFGTLNWVVDTLEEFVEDWKSPDKSKAIMNLLGNIGNGLWKLLDGMIAGVADLIDTTFGTNLKQGYSDFTKYADSIISDVKNAVLGFWDKVLNVFKELSEFVKNPMDFIKAAYKGTTVEEVRRVDNEEKEAKAKSSEMQAQLDKAVEENKLKQTPKEGGFFSNISSVFTKIAGGDKDLKTFIEENNGNQNLAVMNYRSYLTNVKKLSSDLVDKKITEEMNLLNTNTDQSNVSRVIQQNPTTPIQKVADLASASRVYTVEKEAQSSNAKSTPAVIAPVTTQSSSSTVNNNIAIGGLSSARNTSQNASLLVTSNKFN
ncbi:MAG: hypothetical protein JHC26_01775 [Thermofilum sp.]|jgi:hypothetical protein|nr:hypothetical protein [Thermofilum sp.]